LLIGQTERTRKSTIVSALRTLLEKYQKGRV
jgi:hypothetical protein